MSARSLSPPAQGHSRLFHDKLHRKRLLRNLLRYAQIAGYQTYSGLKSEVSRTYLGVVWWLLEPTFAAVTKHIVFGHILSSGAA